LLLKLNGTLVGIDAPEDVNYIASFLRDAVTIVVAARYREKGIILPMLFGLLGAKKFLLYRSLWCYRTRATGKYFAHFVALVRPNLLRLRSANFRDTHRTLSAICLKMGCTPL